MNKEQLIVYLKQELETSPMLHVYELYEKGELIEEGDNVHSVLGWGMEIGSIDTYKEILDLLDEEDDDEHQRNTNNTKRDCISTIFKLPIDC